MATEAANASARQQDVPSHSGRTLGLIAGTTVCNARCPFCISKTTPFQGMTPKLEAINLPRLEHACTLAKKNRIDTVLITGKGEPTLYPEHVTQYLECVQKHRFSRVELQTNAILFGAKPEKYGPILKLWKEKGLDLIAISVVHYDSEKNRSVYTHEKPYIDLPAVIEKLHSFGYRVRLSCTLVKGYIDSVEEMKRMVEFAAKNRVEQLTLRRMEAVEHSENPEISAWTRGRIVAKEAMDQFKQHLKKAGRLVDSFFYGASVFEYGPARQNVCLTTGLTDKILTDEIRQLIFFPSGRIITDWRYDSSKEGDVV